MIKKVLTLFLIAISSSVIAQPASQIPYSPTSSWSIRNGYTNGGNCVTYYDNTYTFLNDSVINGNVYHQLWATGESYQTQFQPGGGCNTTHTGFSEPKGFFRNVGDKVYYLPENSLTESLLYDYDMQVGDTIPETYNHFGFNVTTVVSIDTVIVNGVARRKFNLSTTYVMSTFIIEGIGHERGLFEPMDVMLDFAGQLFCYSENGVAVYPLTNAFCFAGLNNLPDAALVKVYPNPSSGSFELDLSGMKGGVQEITILDANGKKLNLSFKAESNGHYSFSMNTKGVYTVRVIGVNKAVATQKLVII